ncbi:MAG: HD domain-containing protein [Bacteroidaceae bacterium]|nr:HD domain-containing protein [Bacteroidaceae bacterium]
MRYLTDEELKKVIDQPIFREISETADEMGLECYVIGGYVRDLFLERHSHDIDVVVVGSGIAVAQRLKERLGKKAHVSIFQNFGTAQVKYKGMEVEFVGARRESYNRGSRKPIVEDGTLEDDQNRRDFTINAMALCLNADRFGELVDPFYGLEDLEDGIIRTPLDPEVTFSDDPLRMMRCIRFATQLNFMIEDETFEAIERDVERIKIISQERIIEELNKIILSPVPSKGFVDLERSGLLALIFPELHALTGVEVVNGRGHKDNFFHTLEVLDNVARATADWDEKEETSSATESIQVESKMTYPERKLWLRWAALLHDIGKPASKKWDNQLGWTFHSHNYIGQRMVPGIFKRMKLPLNDKMKYVQKLVELHMRPINIADDEVTDSAVRRLLFDAGDDIEDLMLLCEADITSKKAEKKQRFLDNYRLVREKMDALREKDRIRLFQPPIDGEEIMKIFNLRPSREVGILKQAVKDAIVDGTIPNEYDVALAFVLKKAEEIGLKPRNL